MSEETADGVGPAALRGAVLRAWREEAGVGVRALAGLLGVAPGAVTMWEKGQRATLSASNLSLVDRIAEKLALPPDEAQALRDMWQSAASVTALDPRSSWSHNYQWPSGPGWVWLRSPGAPASLSATGWWSDPVRGELTMEVGSGGVFIKFPRTIPNPPLEIAFDSAPGWADFGKGTIPPGVAGRLGATVIDGRDLAKPVQPFESPLQASVFAKLIEAVHGFKSAVENFGPSWSLFQPHFGIARFDRSPHDFDPSALSRTPASAGIRVDEEGWILGQALAEPARFRLIREARGLSREAAAATVTGMDKAVPLTPAVLRGYEDTGTVPGIERFFSRLDAAYGADGQFGLDVTFDSRSNRHARDGIITFPCYWQGPVWLQVHGPDTENPCLLDLTWGPWRRRQYVLSGTVLTTRKAAPDMSPLLFSITPGWQVRAGVGAVPAGSDINHGWYPKDFGAILGLLTTHVKAVFSRGSA